MKVVLEHIRRNVVGYIALFVALWRHAAMPPPRFRKRASGLDRYKNHAIDPIKLNPKFINGNVRAWAVVSSSGRVVAGGGKPGGGPNRYTRRLRHQSGSTSQARLRR